MDSINIPLAAQNLFTLGWKHLPLILFLPFPNFRGWENYLQSVETLSCHEHSARGTHEECDGPSKLGSHTMPGR